MGRYSKEVSSGNFLPPNPNNGHNNYNNYCPQLNYGQPSNNQQPQMFAAPNFAGWPQVFDKPLIGLDLNGLIVEDRLLTGPESVVVLPGVLEAIKMMRLKGHRVFILSDQPDISKGKLSPQNIDAAFQRLMVIFGQAGIMSIDGFLYNTSDIKEDEFAKPNLGMVKRAENEVIRGGIRFKDGWYVGDSMLDLKYADKMGAKPVLIKTGQFQHALEQLEKFTYKDLKQKTAIHNTLLEFANTL